MQRGARIQQTPCSTQSPCWDTEQDPTPNLGKHFPRQAINTGAAIPSGTATGSPRRGEEPDQADLGQQNWEQNPPAANPGPTMRRRKDVSHRMKASAFSSTRVELFSPEISFLDSQRAHAVSSQTCPGHSPRQGVISGLISGESHRTKTLTGSSSAASWQEKGERQGKRSHNTRSSPP